MGKYTLYGQQKVQENTEIQTILSSQVIDLALNGNQDIEVESNPSANGAIIIITLNAETGIAGITPSIFINDEDAASGTAILLRTEVELTASGTTTYVYYPGVSTGGYNGAGVTAAADIALPRHWGLRLAKSTGDSDQNFTAEVKMMYLK